MFGYISEDEYNERLNKIKEKNISNERKRKLKEEKEKHKLKIKIETNKLMAIYLFVLLNAIVIYAMKAMWTFSDLSYLGVLISDIAAQVIVYSIYCLKAYHSKKQEEQIKFEKEKLYENHEHDVNNNAVG